MVYLNFIFYCFVILFAVIGAMRGWAKEMMVTASAILALFVIVVLETYVKGLAQTFAVPGSTGQFWMRIAIVIILAFFGYQTPNLPRIGGDRFARERLQDSLLGVFLGALNGYLIVTNSGCSGVRGGKAGRFRSSRAESWPSPRRMASPWCCSPIGCWRMILHPARRGSYGAPPRPASGRSRRCAPTIPA